MASWWPRQNTWARDNLDTIVIEAKYGGRAYERAKGGGDQVFGKVLTLDRPGHIVFTWQIRPDRSPEPEEALASCVWSSSPLWLQASERRPDWLWVDRLLGEWASLRTAWRVGGDSGRGWKRGVRVKRTWSSRRCAGIALH
ncbi:MAG: hypothetical protein AAB114_00630 [Chloroflexota bacterium]